MSKKSAILVTVQLLCMVFLLMIDIPFADGFGLIFQGIGIVLGLWAIYTIKFGNFNIQPEVKSDYLVKNGPYKWIRNPMYTAVLLFYSPLIISDFTWLKLMVFLVLFITLMMKIYSEEQFLSLKFSNDYLIYKSKTKRLIPFVF